MLTTLFLATAAVIPQQDADTAPPLVPAVSQALVYDDMSGYVRRVTPRLPAAGDFGPEGPRTAYKARPFIPKTQDGSEGLSLSGLSVRNSLTKVLLDQSTQGQVWARGRDYRASFSLEGFTMWPVFGKSSPQEFPVAFSLAQATLGGEPLVTSPMLPTVEGDIVEINQGSLREVYYLDLDQVEQTFVFDELPGQGELVVSLNVSSELAVVVDPTHIRFVHPDFGEVSYGQAFVRDASGRKQAIERDWSDGGITLTVPASFVASAQLPLIIDPPVSSFSNGFGAADDLAPDIAWDGRANRWWVVWQDYTSNVNSDCYISFFSPGGIQGDTFTVELGANYWANPRIAYNFGPDRLLVVASVEVGGVGGDGHIAGRLFDSAPLTFVAAPFIISSIGFRKLTPDVGGSSLDSVPNSTFCVVWSFEGGLDNNAQYRVINSAGAYVSNIVAVNGTGFTEVQTAISDSLGDLSLGGDYWTMAWMEDHGAVDGLGAIFARQVVWNGNPAFTGGNIQITLSSNNAHPSITSRMDRNLVADGERPAIVAYERYFTGPVDIHRSVNANVMTSSTVYEQVLLNYVLEGVDGNLDQRDACIATDGDAFYLVYSEEYYGDIGGGDYDMYMLSGHITESSGGARLALAERHIALATSSDPERSGRVATKWDGEANTTSDDACAIWLAEQAGSVGQVRGSTLEIPTTDVGPETAVGAQFCMANGNGGPTNNVAESTSWIWMEGTQSIGDLHKVHCVDVTPNQFGYLLASPTTADINLPGGSAGRLCVSGAGRYTNQVQSSGTTGTFSSIVNPINIPQPSGSVFASPGQSWYFQYWHRDFINGMSTSNFSNAVQVVFNP